VNDIAYVFGDIVKFSQPLLDIWFPYRNTAWPCVRLNYLWHSVNVNAPTVGIFQRLVGAFTYFYRILRQRTVSHYLVCKVGIEMLFGEVVMCSRF